MSFYFSALILAFALSFLGFGIFISVKIFNFPDITTDGSYTLGAAITAVMLVNNVSPLLAILFSFVAGSIAGSFTGLITTKLKIEPLLSGILMMTALYSINLLIMQKSNIPLSNNNNIFAFIFNESTIANQLLLLMVMAFSTLILLVTLLKTDFGLVLRASGNSKEMMEAMGVNTDKIKIIGLSISNGLTALSGCLVVQYQGFCDINMGIGIVILGLGSVMISESILKFFEINSLWWRLLGVITGTIIFRFILAFALSIGLDPVYLKLITALMVLLVVGLPGLKKS
ncbi:MAG: ABC transporter permease [Bacteroidota bacterium]|jgi:putative ABC transport system permease protein